jgi:hypothetical protein
MMLTSGCYRQATRPTQILKNRDVVAASDRKLRTYPVQLLAVDDGAENSHGHNVRTMLSNQVAENSTGRVSG